MLPETTSLRRASLPVVTMALALVSAAIPAHAEDPTAADLGLMEGFNPPEGKRVDASNWLVYLLNRWAYQNVRRFMPTAALPSNPAIVVPLEENRQNLDDVKVALEGGERTFRDIMEAWQTDSIVVLYNGELVYERYWNGLTAHKPHAVFSVSKSYIGTLGAMLVERGVIDCDATAASYVPELAESAFADATIGQILDMTAGTSWDESPAAIADASSPARQYGAASGSMTVPGIPSIGVAGSCPALSRTGLMARYSSTTPRKSTSWAGSSPT